MSGIKIEITNSLPDFAVAWAELIARAETNIFLDPAALAAVHVTGFAKVHVLLAWRKGTEPARLVGVWALGEKHLAPLGPRILVGPAYEYSFLSGPVIDPACEEEVVEAFLKAIAEDRRLPNTLSLRYLDADSGPTAALLRALAARQGKSRILAERARPYASRESGQKLSGSTRKKLRQDWNRLSAVGAVDIVNDRDSDAARRAFETFLAMEVASWKGASGTALLSKSADAAFARRLIGDLAADGKASVALLRVDGKAVAAQVLLYSGPTAYTWKTAFDAEFGKFSPGMLLIDRLTEQLFAGGVAAIESCSPEGGFMSQLWAGSRTTVDLLANVGPGRSLGYALAAMREQGRAELKRIRNRIRSHQWPSLPKRKLAAAS